MGEAAITTWKNKYSELSNRFKNFREHSKEIREHGTQVMLDSLLTGVGGAGAAVLESKIPEIMGVDSKLVVGAGLLGLAFLDLDGQYADQLTALGSGVLAVSAYEQTKAALAK